MRWRNTWRKFVNYFMFSMTGLCALVAVGVLFFILGYLVWNGGSSLSWAFLTHLPTPVGEPGGGMANAIVGSGKLLLLASAFGIPIGFLGGVYLAEFGGRAFPFVVRYTADLLNGVPSIVMGIFALHDRGLADETFFNLGGKLGAGRDDDPHRRAQHGRSPAHGPADAAGRRLALGGEQMENDRHRGRAGGPQGDCHGDNSGSLLASPVKRRRCCSPPSAIGSGARGGISLRPRCRSWSILTPSRPMKIGTGRPGLPDWFS